MNSSHSVSLSNYELPWVLLLCSALLKGAYYEEEHWKREWSYVVLLPVLSTCLAIVCLILFYHGFVHVLGVHAPAAFFMLMSLSLLMCWVADRTKGELDKLLCQS